MLRNVLLVMLSMFAVPLSGSMIHTPEIRGRVLDAETKQPVPEAWVHAVIGVTTRTVGGESYDSLSLDRGHLRSNEKGDFVIPSREFQMPAIPYGFGSKISHFTIIAETIDDRIGGVELKDFKWKRVVDPVSYIEPWERKVEKERSEDHSYIFGFFSFLGWTDLKKTESEELYKSYLRSHFTYCLSGRFLVEKPPVEGGCDQWELNYSIIKHEKYLKRIGEPKSKDQRTNYSIAMEQLGYLYKWKKDYRKSLETFTTVLEFDRKRNVNLSIDEYRRQISELEKLIAAEEK